MTHLRKMMLEELQARKITAPVLGWIEDSRGSIRYPRLRSCRSIFQVLSCFDRLVTAGPRSS